MNIRYSRRKFLHSIGLVAGASITSTSWIAGEPRSARRVGIARRSLTRVIKFTNKYGEKTCLCGLSGAIEATGSNLTSPVYILVSVAQKDRLTQILQQEKGLPFTKVRIEGNTLSLHYSGRDYFIKNLSPAAYTRQVKQINSRGQGAGNKDAAYAHHYITYETSNRKLTDPHQAIQNNKMLFKKAIGDDTPLDFEAVIDGMIESSTMHIPPSAKLSTEWTSILSDTKPNNPKSIVKNLLTRLHDITTSMDQKKITKLLRSPLVSTSLDSILEVNGQAIIASHSKLQSNNPRSCKASHLWHAAFLVACPQGTSNRTLQDGFLNNVSSSAAHTAAARWRIASSLKP